MIDIIDDPFPDDTALRLLWARAWDSTKAPAFGAILKRSLAHVGAMADGQLVGFVNVAWDGGVHAFLLDTTVDPAFRRRGLATRLVARAAQLAQERGAQWLHVDYEAHLEGFYRGCGFVPTMAGLIRLA